MGRNAIQKLRKENPAKKLEITLGLIDFFSQNSLAQSNMDDVAKGLDRSKATLYKYFSTKEEMVAAVIEFKISEVSKFVQILTDSSLDFLERYEKSFALLELHIKDISNDFIKDLKEVFPAIYRKIELLIDLAVNQLAVYYKEGMDLGVFNKLNPKLLSYNDFVFFQTMTDPEFLKENNLSLNQAFKDFYEIRCNGLISN